MVRERDIESGALLDSYTKIQSQRPTIFTWKFRIAAVAIFAFITFCVACLMFTAESADPEKGIPTKYRIHIISDDDQASLDGDRGVWVSHFWSGTLNYPTGADRGVEWTEKSEVTTQTNERGRAMELSELLYFNGELLACDDRTGLVFALRRTPKGAVALTRHVLLEGDGVTTNKGFKCEWATEYKGKAIFGSFGKEFADPKDGHFIHARPMWIKQVSKAGMVKSIDWKGRYDKLRAATKTEYPGYLLHEAVTWSDHLNAWVIIPRRESQEAYTEDRDQVRGTDLILIANDGFTKITELRVEQLLIPKRGFSSFKFIPGRPDEVVALRTEELTDSEGRGQLRSYIVGMKIDVAKRRVTVTMPERLVGAHKFEGLEIESLD